MNFYTKHLTALWQARLDLALGCQQLMGKERDGTFTRITDPDKMLTVLKSGATFSTQSDADLKCSPGARGETRC